MKYARWLPFPSATATAIAFFLPWFSISCKSPTTQKQEKVAFTGYNLASGKMPPVVEAIFLVQQKLAGLGNIMMSFFKKKKTKPVVKKKNPLKMLRNGLPSFWGALGCFGFAALLGLWFAIRGPTPWLRAVGIFAIVAGVACLLYPVLTHMPKFKGGSGRKIRLFTTQVEIGGYLLLSGIAGSLLGFLTAPSENRDPKK